MRIGVFLKVGGSSLPSTTIYRVIIWLLLLLLLLLKKKKRKRIHPLLHAAHSLKGANCALSPRELGFLYKRGRIKAFTQTNKQLTCLENAGGLRAWEAGRQER